MPNTGPTAWTFPDLFLGKTGYLSAYEPFIAYTGSGISSFAPPNHAFIHWAQPTPLIFKNIMVEKSLSPGVPGATAQASTGSEAWSYANTAYLFSRSDYSANSTLLSFMASGSFGLTATLGYSSSSQVFGMSWVTDTAGGTSNVTTTSNDAGWSNLASGMRLISIPFPATTLPQGEYWMAFGQSSTSATSNSNITLLSVSDLDINFQAGNIIAGYLGQTNTNATVLGPNIQAGFIGAAPTTSAAMELSRVIQGVRGHWFGLSNA